MSKTQPDPELKTLVELEDTEADRRLTRDVRALARVIEGAYDDWIRSEPGLESPQAQMVLFTVVAKRLAMSETPRIGLGQLLTQVARAYGLELENFDIQDAEGNTLVKRGEIPAPRVLARESGRKDH